ncbi:zinc finger protein ZAT9-like [Cicer arietinum]|uniref:Zinc finger protein ZAT9-like n=1 Tax=Cicer arietinum TaxID=3827 RepID=A0A1S2YL88_CICAR|nr:zinc finger protein ZAT9-like [Cicer arietinum]
MEKKCKLCFRSFSNGRALGGHMRSHVMNLPIPPKPKGSPPPTIQLSFEAESASSPSSSSSYGLRDKPKRSFLFTDPNQFIESSSEILQDRESETESSKNPTRPRSKRVKKLDTVKPNESVLSSASDITTEEDIALCLMLLSRDSNNNWKTKPQTQPKHQEYEEEKQKSDENEDEEEESEAEPEEIKPFKAKNTKKLRARYKCDTCNKMFRSYQALGGHRASHKKIKLINDEIGVDSEEEKININNINGESKIHECPVCYRVFNSGQALGGHKRTHGIVGSTTIATVTTNSEVRSSVKFGNSFIDLNLPAPTDDDDDDVSQIEGSAVSDAEFV